MMFGFFLRGQIEIDLDFCLIIFLLVLHSKRFSNWSLKQESHDMCKFHKIQFHYKHVKNIKYCYIGKHISIGCLLESKKDNCLQHDFSIE